MNFPQPKANVFINPTPFTPTALSSNHTETDEPFIIIIIEQTKSEISVQYEQW